MADENTVEEGEGTTVEVTVETPEPVVIESEPEAPPAPVVVVEDDNATEGVAVETAIDHEGRLARMELVLESLANAVAELGTRTELAREAANAAVDVAIEAQETAEEAAEGEQAPASEDSAPDKEHWYFK